MVGLIRRVATMEGLLHLMKHIHLLLGGALPSAAPQGLQQYLRSKQAARLGTDGWTWTDFLGAMRD
jgi:hypothetical protein